MRFDVAEPPHTQKHTTSKLKVNYYVNPAEVKDYTKSQRKQLDDSAERRYMHHLNVNCDFEQQTRSQLIQEAQGWFFIDEEKMAKANQMELKSCRRLNELTRKANSWL
jgi:DnaJ family protein B protein 12